MGQFWLYENFSPFGNRHARDLCQLYSCWQVPTQQSLCSKTTLNKGEVLLTIRSSLHHNKGIVTLLLIPRPLQPESSCFTPRKIPLHSRALIWTLSPTVSTGTQICSLPGLVFLSDDCRLSDSSLFNLQHLVYPIKLSGRIFPNEYTVEACSYRKPLEIMINELYKAHATTQYQASSIGCNL